MRINKNLSTVSNSLQEINVLHTSISLFISLKYVPYHEKKTNGVRINTKMNST